MAAKKIDVLSLEAAVERARAEGLPVSLHALRGWIKAGRLPVRYVGRKALLYWPNLRDFLACAHGSDNSPTDGRLQ